VKRLAKCIAPALLLGAFAHPAYAESCTRSRDYVLSNAAGDLPQKPQSYQDLFKICLEATQLSNVKDAFILKDGAVAIVPKQDDVASTARTLAQFCSRFPRGTVHFVTRRELPDAAILSRAVKISSRGSTPCHKIVGGAP
jgi:hypothetical protein